MCRLTQVLGVCRCNAIPSLSFREWCILEEKAAGHKKKIKPRIAQILAWFRTRPSKLARLTPKMLRRHYKMALNMTPDAIQFLSQTMGSTPEEEAERAKLWCLGSLEHQGFPQFNDNSPDDIVFQQLWCLRRLYQSGRWRWLNTGGRKSGDTGAQK